MLQVTTQHDLFIFLFKDGLAYKFCLRPGTYLCRKIKHPFGESFDDLVVLDQPQVYDANLPAEAIVGLSYQGLLAHTHYKHFPDLLIDCQEVANTTEELLALAQTANPAPVAANASIKMERPIIILRPRTSHNFVKHHPRRGLSTTDQTNRRHRVLICHPAARRAC